MIRDKIKHSDVHSEKSYASLRFTMLCNLLFALAVAVALFFLSSLFFSEYVENVYLSDEKKEGRINKYRDALQTYVTENNLSSDDTDRISAWAKAQKYLYILVYKGDQLVFETGWYEEEKVENKENADDGTEKPVEKDPDSSDKSDVEDEENEGGTGTDNKDPGSTDQGGTTPDDSNQGGTDLDDPDQGNTDHENTNQGEGTPDDSSQDATDSDGENQDGDKTDGVDSDKDNTDEKDPGTESEEKDPPKKEENKYQSIGITVKTPTREELIAAAKERDEQVILTADGGTLIAWMADFTEYLYYDIFNIVSILLAFIGFILVMWLYFFGITKKITRLGREVTAVADGDINRKITADGQDEITRLCADVEYMRISMLENIEKERAALEANKELITAMSHDIRTPLTVLLGYLDIMKLNATDEDMQQYLEVSERTALRLKKMSDDMFSYFLVYGGGAEVEVQECDARTLVDQMLSGHVFLLREQGYNIDFNFEAENNEFLENVIVVTDPPQLMRIVENLFSNIMKYADKEKTVTVYVDSDIDEMTIKVSNFVASNPDEAQKNGIGLRSCMKLANAMDIRFSAEEEGEIFTSLLYIPIIPDIDYSSVDITENKEGFVQWLKYIFAKCKNSLAKVLDKMKSLFAKKE